MTSKTIETPVRRRNGWLRSLVAALAVVGLSTFSARALDGDSAELVLRSRLFLGAPNDIELAGAFAHVAADTGLAVFDVSGSEPVPVGSAYLPSQAHDVALSSAGTVAFVANGESGLQVLDVGDPSKPLLLGTFGAPAARAVAVRGTRAYLGDVGTPGSGDFRLRIVEASLPSSPVQLGSVTLGNGPLGVDVDATHAYLALGSELAMPQRGLAIVDVTDPASPSLDAFHDVGLPANAVQVVGGMAYVAAGFSLIGSLVVIDVSSPTAPVELSSVPLADSATDVNVVGGVAHVTTRSLGLLTYDVVDPANPFRIDGIPVGGDAWSVAADGMSAHVAVRSSAGTAGLSTIDTPAPPLPLTERGSWRTAEATDVARADGVAYLLRRDGLHAYDMADPATPMALDSWMPTAADLSLVAADGPLVAVAEGSTVWMVELGGGGTLMPRGTVSSANGTAVGLALGNDRLYLVNGRELEVHDVSNPSSPSLVGSLPMDGWASAVSVAGGTCHVAVGQTLQVYDALAPGSPMELGRIDLGSPVYAVDADDSIAVLGGIGTYLHVVDVSNPAAPALLADVPGGMGFGIELIEQRALVAADSEGVLLFDLTTPSMPVLEGWYDTAGSAVAVAAGGGQVHAATVDAQHWTFGCATCLGGCSLVVDVTPLDPDTCDGDDVTLTASAAGCAAGVSFQWYEDGMLIPGATGPDHVVPGTHAPGDHVVTVEAQCVTDPSCVAVAASTVEIHEWIAPTVAPASLRIAKIPFGEHLTWSFSSGTGETDVHRALDPWLLAPAALMPDTIVRVSASTSYTNAFTPPPGRVAYFRVFGHPDCAASSP